MTAKPKFVLPKLALERVPLYVSPPRYWTLLRYNTWCDCTPMGCSYNEDEARNNTDPVTPRLEGHPVHWQPCCSRGASGRSPSPLRCSPDVAAWLVSTAQEHPDSHRCGCRPGERAATASSTHSNPPVPPPPPPPPHLHARAHTHMHARTGREGEEGLRGVRTGRQSDCQTNSTGRRSLARWQTDGPVQRMPRTDSAHSRPRIVRPVA